jgi:hypothetical protein
MEGHPRYFTLYKIIKEPSVWGTYIHHHFKNCEHQFMVILRETIGDGRRWDTLYETEFSLSNLAKKKQTMIEIKTVFRESF